MNGATASIPSMVWQRVHKQPGATILRKKDRGIWKSVSWEQLGARTRHIGMALKDSGFAAGDVACIVSETRPEWVYAELGILSVGGISAGLYPSEDAEQLARMLQRSGARVVFVENEEQLDKVLQARERGVDVARIVIFDTKGLRDLADPSCESLMDFLARGAAYDTAHPDEWTAGVASLREEAPALIAYTPGTSGGSKAVVLSHRNVLSQLGNAADALGYRAGDERVAFLPAAHVMERVLGQYLALYTGTISNYVEGPDTVSENLKEVQPTVLNAPPRVWERIRAQIASAAADATLFQQTAFRWALSARESLIASERNGKPASLLTRVQAAVASFLVLRKVRQALGLNRVHTAYVGGEPVAPALIGWFRALGIDLLEIYGQTESAGLSAAMMTRAMRRGRTDGLVPLDQVKIAEDGEILLRGEHVFLGYWQGRAERDRPDWLPTGDLGVIDQGHLRVIGRRADMITTSGGKRVSPSSIEAALTGSPYIANAAIFGEGREYLSSLIAIDEETIEKWAQRKKIPFAGFASLAQSEAVQDLIRGEIERVTAELPEGNLIKRFHLLGHKLNEGDPELTPMLRLRRDVVSAKYRDLIEAMYRGA